MYLGISQNKIYANQPIKFQAEAKTSSVESSSYAQNPTSKVSFGSNPPSVNLKTELVTKEEKDKYALIVSASDKKNKKKLELLLKNGILLNSNSNDKSTTLDNLYKIMTTQRARGLSPEVVLADTINTIANPFIITQQFGDIPKPYVGAVLQKAHENHANDGATINNSINEKTINVENSGTCVASSIEFNLAQRMPAEFARFANELTSPKVAVEKNIKMSNLANNTLDGVWLLNAFKIPYVMNDFDNAKLTLAPDKDAIIAAQIQNKNKDPWERSLVDVLMQSTFMNVGSQQSYETLTDNRAGDFTQNNTGLIEFEKTFTESVVEDKNKISVTYQKVDENAKLIGYETDFKTMKKHILDSLSMGENVIIGYTQVDDTNKIINGHEITIIGTKKDSHGKLTFICNDTDDGKSAPIEYSEDYLVPKIHHAGLPQKVVDNDMKFVDNWVDGINYYKESKKAQLNQPAPSKVAA